MQNLKYQPLKFNSHALANSCANRMNAGAVMLGNDGKFWVVCMADAARLEAAGFEWAN